MAQKAQPNDSIETSSRKAPRAIAAEDFMTPYSTDTEAERPLSPGLVARVTEVNPKKAKFDEAKEGDANAPRVTRETERTRLNERPSSAWPG